MHLITRKRERKLPPREFVYFLLLRFYQGDEIIMRASLTTPRDVLHHHFFFFQSRAPAGEKLLASPRDSNFT